MSSVSYISVVGNIISVIKFIYECFYILVAKKSFGLL